MPNGLVTKLARVMGKVQGVKKTGHNAHFKYDYVEERALTEAVRGFLAEEGVFVFPSVVEHQQNGTLATVLMEFTFVDGESGDTFAIRMAGQGDDKGDKAYYKAYTGAQKYMLMKTFLIPTGDDPEADTDTDKRNEGKASGPAPRAQQSPPNNVRQMPQQAAQQQASSGALSDKQIKRLFAISKAAGWSEERLRASVKGKFGHDHLTDMSREQYDTVCVALQQVADELGAMAAN